MTYVLSLLQSEFDIHPDFIIHYGFLILYVTPFEIN